MNEFERDLEHGLRRWAPQYGFTDRVMWRIGRERRQRALRRRTVACILLLCVSAGAGQLYWRREQRRFARQQLELAMRVTTQTLLEVQRQIGRTTLNLDEVNR